MEIAIGLTNWAWMEASSWMGSRPMKVVTEVSNTGRKRRTPPSITASRHSSGCARKRSLM